MSAAYFNEIDPFCAEWLEALYPGATVERRSIHEVRGADVVGLARQHYFAGVGGWEHALRLAGWPAEWPVWTGSCPCQPFSTAGKRGGVNDERHLWPEFFRLIGERRPPVILGEQVASKDGLGWLDGVFADLEGAGYACGAADLCAAGLGAPHIRQRLFWAAVGPGVFAGNGVRGGLAESEDFRHLSGGFGDEEGAERSPPRGREPEGCRGDDIADGGDPGRLALAERAQRGQASGPGFDVLNGAEAGRPQGASGPELRGAVGGVGIPGGDGLARHPGAAPGEEAEGQREGVCDGCGGVKPPDASGTLPGGVGHAQLGGRDGLHERGEPGHLAADPGGDGSGDVPGLASGTPWSDCLVIPCRDGKLRRVSAQPGDEPLAHGIPARADDPRMGYLLARLAELGHDSRAARRILREARRNRVGRLRGYGNAIVPVVAAEFIKVVMEHLKGD